MLSHPSGQQDHQTPRYDVHCSLQVTHRYHLLSGVLVYSWLHTTTEFNLPSPLSQNGHHTPKKCIVGTMPLTMPD